MDIFKRFDAIERKALNISLIVGLILGAIVDIILLFGPLTAVRTAEPWVRTAIIIVTLAIVAFAAMVLSCVFVWLVIKAKVGAWRAIPLGAIAGLVVGGIVFGLGIAVEHQLSFTYGITAGMTGGDAPTWSDMVGSNAVGGFIYGSFVGFFLGIPAAVVTAMLLRKSKVRST